MVNHIVIVSWIGSDPVCCPLCAYSHFHLCNVELEPAATCFVFHLRDCWNTTSKALFATLPGAGVPTGARGGGMYVTVFVSHQPRTRGATQGLLGYGRCQSGYGGYGGRRNSPSESLRVFSPLEPEYLC